MYEVTLKNPTVSGIGLYAGILDWLLTSIYKPSIVMTRHTNYHKVWKADDVWVLKSTAFKGLIKAEFKNPEDAVAFRLRWG